MKIIVTVAGIGVVGATLVVVVQQSRQPRKKIAPPPDMESELPTAFSNYSSTFKLNTNPPFWITPAHGRNATN